MRDPQNRGRVFLRPSVHPNLFDYSMLERVNLSPGWVSLWLDRLDMIIRIRMIHYLHIRGAAGVFQYLEPFGGYRFNVYELILLEGDILALGGAVRAVQDAAVEFKGHLAPYDPEEVDFFLIVASADQRARSVLFNRGYFPKESTSSLAKIMEWQLGVLEDFLNPLIWIPTRVKFGHLRLLGRLTVDQHCRHFS